MKTTELRIQDGAIHCESCEGRINTVLERISGVARARASREEQSVTVVWDEQKTTLDQIEAAIDAAGYPVNQTE